jgi:hypothetical protein
MLHGSRAGAPSNRNPHLFCDRPPGAESRVKAPSALLANLLPREALTFTKR